MYSKLLCDIILLPVTTSINHEWPIWKQVDTDLLFTNYFSGFDVKAQHLYLISKRKIKEGDWYIENGKTISCCKTTEMGQIDENFLRIYCKRIEASTDDSLCLPSISKEFIDFIIQNNRKVTQTYIETYIDVNKKLVICRTKSNDKFYINIIPVKLQWSRNEIIENIENAKKAMSWGHTKDGIFISEEWLYKSFGIDKN